MSNEYHVLARKWRPQEFQNLVGQDHISKTLINAIKNNRVPHALLFTGPRGTGKTSSARILAKTLKCQKAIDFVPCQECTDCVDIANSRHIDVIEIDGASNNGVDAVRELRDSVGYSASSGMYKVYIIDEVHMLSTSAFNALLKTLEEPPAHVVFILATTEVQKIPNTILSRCQRYDFRMISQQEIKTHLAKVCGAEQVTFEEDALWLIARQAKGSMRDAQSLLDQIITFSNGKVTLETVTDNLGLVQRVLINNCLKGILQKDISLISMAIADIGLSGTDPMLFIESILEQLRNLLMIKIGADKMQVPIAVPESEMDLLREWSVHVTEEDIHLLFDIALRGSQNLVRAAEPRLALEMLCLKMGSAPRVASIAQLLESGVTRNEANPAPVAKSAPKTIQKNTNASPTTTAPRASAPMPAAEPPPREVEISLEQTLQNITDPWMRFVETVRQSNGLLAALIEHTHIIEQDDTKLRLGLPDKMAFLFGKVNDPANLERVSAFIQSFWKKTLKISVEMTKPNAATAAATMSPKDRSVQTEQARVDKERADVEKHPLVQKTNSLFKTEIRSIKEEKPS
ncbi:MAG: DNA polymerase III subunit gamma/tau [Bdellovibrionaceae bacterium]|nr:DNA polymerase III subunit gamma/tau [Pseudobdellovibrionaceae bacterium]